MFERIDSAPEQLIGIADNGRWLSVCHQALILRYCALRYHRPLCARMLLVIHALAGFGHLPQREHDQHQNSEDDLPCHDIVLRQSAISTERPRPEVTSWNSGYPSAPISGRS